MIALMVFGLSYTANSQTLVNKNTRKGYDLRPGDYDSLANFIGNYHKALPYIIAVGTQDEKFIREIKTIVKTLDEEGSEHLTLILYALSSESLTNRVTHSVIFIKNGHLKVGIEKIKGRWGYTGVTNERELSTIILQESSYPIDIIKTQVRSLYDE